MDPLVYGHYPAIMRNILQDRLPTFSEDEAEVMKGSFDFIGLNHYTSHYAKNEPDGPEFSHYGVEMHDAGVASVCMSPPSIFLSLYVQFTFYFHFMSLCCSNQHLSQL